MISKTNTNVIHDQPGIHGLYGPSSFSVMEVGHTIESSEEM